MWVRWVHVAVSVLLVMVGTNPTLFTVVATTNKDDIDSSSESNSGSNEQQQQRLSYKERIKLLRKQQDQEAMELRSQGFTDHVGHSKQAAILRSYQLRKKKRNHRKHGWLWRLFSSSSSRGRAGNTAGNSEDASMMDILFPGMKPELYKVSEQLFVITDQCRSRKTHVPYDFYDTVPGCPVPSNLKNFKRIKRRHQRKNLGARLQGADLKPAPFFIKTLQNLSCTTICSTELEPSQIRFLRKLVERQYRIHVQLDQLPVLMRSSKYNYAIRGYPIGFVAPSSYTGLDHDEYYLYNHVKFIITYHRVPSAINSKAITTSMGRRQRGRKLEEDSSKTDDEEDVIEEDEGEGESQIDDASGGDIEPDVRQEAGRVIEPSVIPQDIDGIYITGFDVLPISIEHAPDGSTCTAASAIYNDPNTYLAIRGSKGGTTLPVQYSYEVEWIESDLPWEDRWDVYLIGSPDDDIHFFAIINSLMVVLLLTGAIATIMIRTLRKDIMTYNEMSNAMSNDPFSHNTTEETGWKLVHGDVFRPPTNQNPILLSCLVGTGTQICCAALLTLLLSLLKVVNPIKKGQTLTAVLALFVLSGFVSGYISARLYKFCNAKNWKLNTIVTAMGLPGIFVAIYTVLNTLLSIENAATAVSFFTLFQIFAMWVGISAPLVFVGSYFGYRADALEVPTKTNQIARYIPTDLLPWYTRPPLSSLVGGILPFGCVCIELFFIMSALWLHQMYYVMGFLLAVLLILVATCAQVSIVMDYLQLCVEDYNWWWKSFFNCASAGLYLFLYSLWFLVSRLELVGLLSVTIYITYMAMISLCFSLLCGSIGFLCAFWFNTTIYGALHKVD